MVQSAITPEDAIFQLRVRSEKQTERGRTLHIRYSSQKSDLMFCFPSHSGFKSIELQDRPPHLSLIISKSCPHAPPNTSEFTLMNLSPLNLTHLLLQLRSTTTRKSQIFTCKDPRFTSLCSSPSRFLKNPPSYALGITNLVEWHASWA
jgi:hypothetical protein